MLPNNSATCTKIGGFPRCWGKAIPLLRSYITEDPGLHAGNELHLARAHLVLQKSVNIERALGIDPVDDAPSIKGNAVAMQQLHRGENFGEDGLAVFADAVGVVQFRGAVDAEPDQEVVLLEKDSPVVVEQDSVGLQVVLDPLTGLLVSLFRFDDSCEEVKTEPCGLATLPGEDDLLAVLPLDVLANMGFQDLVSDLELAVAAQQLFSVQVITTGAADIADRANGVSPSREARLARSGRLFSLEQG